MGQQSLFFLTPPPIKKKRRPADNLTLESNFRDEKYKAESQTKDCYAGRQRASHEGTAVPFFKRALYAAKMSWAWQGEVDMEIKKVDEFVRKHLIFSALKENMAEVRRTAVEFVYIQMLGEPQYAPIVVKAVKRLSVIAQSSVVVGMHMASLTGRL
jgi:hypothetical protein